MINHPLIHWDLLHPRTIFNRMHHRHILTFNWVHNKTCIVIDCIRIRYRVDRIVNASPVLGMLRKTLRTTIDQQMFWIGIRSACSRQKCLQTKYFLFMLRQSSIELTTFLSIYRVISKQTSNHIV